MKATDFLEKQHKEVMKLFKQVEKSEEPRARKRIAELGEQLEQRAEVLEAKAA